MHARELAEVAARCDSRIRVFLADPHVEFTVALLADRFDTASTVTPAPAVPRASLRLCAARRLSESSKTNPPSSSTRAGCMTSPHTAGRADLPNLNPPTRRHRNHRARHRNRLLGHRRPRRQPRHAHGMIHRRRRGTVTRWPGNGLLPAIMIGKNDFTCWTTTRVGTPGCHSRLSQPAASDNEGEHDHGQRERSQTRGAH